MEDKLSKYLTDSEETEWITLTRQGHNAAFTNIVEKYQRPVYNLCYHMLRDAMEAEDAAQEVFLRAYAKLDSYDDRRRFSSWLFSIASHYCLDRLKRPRIFQVPWDNFPVEYRLPTAKTFQPETALLSRETTQEIQRLLKTLPPDYRAAVVLKYWYAMSYQEIARTLDTTTSAIKSKLFRARKMMAQVAIRRQNIGAPLNVVSAI